MTTAASPFSEEWKEQADGFSHWGAALGKGQGTWIRWMMLSWNQYSVFLVMKVGLLVCILSICPLNRT